jgi:hypothetical protein
MGWLHVDQLTRARFDPASSRPPTGKDQRMHAVGSQDADLDFGVGRRFGY